MGRSTVSLVSIRASDRWSSWEFLSRWLERSSDHLGLPDPTRRIDFVIMRFVRGGFASCSHVFRLCRPVDLLQGVAHRLGIASLLQGRLLEPVIVTLGLHDAAVWSKQGKQ